mgnify:CR=1 FL=1
MSVKLLISIIGAIGLLAGAGFAAHGRLRGRPAAGRVSMILGLAVVVANAAVLAVQIRVEGILPTMRHSYESSLTLTTTIVLVGLAAARLRSLRGIDAVLFLFGSIVQFGSFFQIGAPQVGVPYQPWFISHQVAFILGATCFAASGAAGAVYVTISELMRRKRRLVLLGRFAPLESLEQFGRWTLVLGFPAMTYGVLTGFCYLSRQTDPGPRAWLTDPFIVVVLALWASYAGAVSALCFVRRMRGRRGAMMAAAGLVLLIVVFVVMGHVSTLHR